MVQKNRKGPAKAPFFLAMVPQDQACMSGWGQTYSLTPWQGEHTPAPLKVKYLLLHPRAGSVAHLAVLHAPGPPAVPVCNKDLPSLLTGGNGNGDLAK